LLLEKSYGKIKFNYYLIKILKSFLEVTIKEFSNGYDPFKLEDAKFSDFK
jgi:hypothetical protein